MLNVTRILLYVYTGCANSASKYYIIIENIKTVLYKNRQLYNSQYKIIFVLYTVWVLAGLTKHTLFNMGQPTDFLGILCFAFVYRLLWDELYDLDQSNGVLEEMAWLAKSNMAIRK